MPSALVDYGDHLLHARMWGVQLIDCEVVFTCKDGFGKDAYRFSRVEFDGKPAGTWRACMQDCQGEERPVSISTLMVLFAWVVERFGGDWERKIELDTGLPPEE